MARTPFRKPTLTPEGLRKKIYFDGKDFYRLPFNDFMSLLSIEWSGEEIYVVYITHNDPIPAASLVYYLETGEWYPLMRFKDGNRKNFSFENLSPHVYRGPSINHQVKKTKLDESGNIATKSAFNKGDQNRLIATICNDDRIKLDSSHHTGSQLVNSERYIEQAYADRSPPVSDHIDISNVYIEDKLSEKLLYAESALFKRESGDQLLDSLVINGLSRSPEQIAYFAFTGKWFESVIQIDISRGLSYDNLIHSDFVLSSVKNLTPLRGGRLGNLLDFDNGTGDIYWKYNRSYIGLRNSFLQNKAVDFHYSGSQLVNWFGEIYLYTPFAQAFFDDFEKMRG
ncbi:hypothetical protein [Neptunomonas qingdaonensis]|uniref:Uncharacterized protein n=1 Tax=Neptunomonas qingdaonensis TaxID=1045558 RepID=A0A1I2TX87_9GAMM|nr:hypothetical protein [Neptunomonas qingdaonensis]SFG68829.1 hypothetical protein SAMN05216175_11138 [Neptunomonas qingdaonensis]